MAAFLAKTLAKVLAQFGRVDILVCAAGRPLRKNALESTDADFDALMAVNVKAVFQWNQAFGHHMIERGKGAIINIASQGAFSALRRPLYAASKASIVQLTKTLAVDWIKFGVRVNAIAPGLMDTPFIAEMKQDPARIARDVARIPAGRLGRPADLAGAVLLLASDASAYIVGQTLIVDGGWTITDHRGPRRGAYRFLLHDRDAISSPWLDAAHTAMGVRVLRTPFKPQW